MHNAGMADPVPPLPDELSSPSPADRLAALKFYVDLANSEKQAIWARHATMVVGNVLLINAVLEKQEGLLNRLLDVAGLLICFLWAVMTWVGWTWFNKLLRDGKALGLPPLLNPFATFPDIGDRHSDPIFKCTMAMVVIFGLFYVGDLVRPFYEVPSALRP